ncbi:MAG TPA: glycosyltransferase family 87 protein [Mesorhizobium sp.]|jgi:hypothetical protein|nr:glycosyltransferase family 87 protein [Mesorhizobium sp.]
MTAAPRGVRAAAAALIALALLALIAWHLQRSLPTPGLLDYGSFLESGRAAARGENPYGIYPLTFHVVLPGFESWNPNLNPPAALPLFELFDMASPVGGFRIWWGLSFVAYAVAVALLAHRYAGERWILPVLWAFALAGFWDTLVLGQIYLPLLLFGILGWLLLDRGHLVLAGIAIGVVVAIKPNFLVWPGLLFLAGHWRAPVSAGLTFAVLGLVPLLLYGPEVYGQWVELIRNDEGRAAFLTNASLPGIGERAGAGTAALALSALLLIALAVWAFWRKPLPLEASTLGLIGSLVASPIAWVHYTLFLLPVFFAFRLNWPLRLAAVLLLAPVPLVLRLMNAEPLVQATVGSVYGWAVVLCLLGAIALLRGQARTTADPSAEAAGA